MFATFHWEYIPIYIYTPIKSIPCYFENVRLNAPYLWWTYCPMPEIYLIKMFWNSHLLPPSRDWLLSYTQTLLVSDFSITVSGQGWTLSTPSQRTRCSQLSTTAYSAVWITFLNRSSCLYVSGSSSCETFFIQFNEARYSVRTFSMLLTFCNVSSIARCRNVSTSCNQHLFNQISQIIYCLYWALTWMRKINSMALVCKQTTLQETAACWRR
jgi:hypothetical protein